MVNDIGLNTETIAVVCIIAVTPTLQQRLATLSNPFEDQRHTRIPIWLTALEEFKDNPILGVGFPTPCMFILY